MRNSTPTAAPRPARHRAPVLAGLLAGSLLAGLLAFVPTPIAGAAPRQDPPTGVVDPLLDPPPAVPVPADAVPADLPLAAGCSLTVDGGGAKTRTCDLWIRSGAVTIGGDALPVWVFADTETGPLTYPGPVLVVESDESLVVNVHHRSADVGEASLSIPAAPVAPDVAGISNGGDRTYSFGPLAPGTYGYGAGPTLDGGLQLAMGMAGVLVVHPAGFAAAPVPTAFADAGNPVPFDDEVVVAVSEIDPRVNADPHGFDRSFFNPTLFLVNGQPYPEAAAIELQAGHNVYLRYANLGTQARSLQLPGLRQTRYAEASQRLRAPVDVAVQPLPPGAVAETMVHLPAGTDATVAVLDAGLHLHSGTDPGTQGMVALIHLPEMGGVVTGPTTSQVATGTPTVTGATQLGISATVTSGAPGGVTDAEYFVDDLDRDPDTGLLLGGTPMIVSPGGTSPVTAAGAISVATLAALANGEHSVWVHGLDANGWGFVAASTFVIDRDGPVVHGVELSPAISDGTTLHVQATADSTLTGTGTDIREVRYSLDAPPATPGGGTVLASAPFANSPNPARASVAADIDLSTLGLPDGPHTLYLEALDSAGDGHWSQVATPTTFTIDTAGPTIATAAVAVTPNNGTIAAQGPIGFLDAVRVTAEATDAGSGIVAAEVSLGATAAAAGTGDAMVSVLASWGHGTPGAYAESVYAELPLAAVRSMAEGDVTIWVRARDAAGNWGAASSTTLRLDKTPPTVTLTSGPASGQVTVDATDPVSGGVNTDIVAVEHFTGPDPGIGLATALEPGTDFTVGTSVTALLSGFSSGEVVGVRVRDEAGSWSTTVRITVP